MEPIRPYWPLDLTADKPLFPKAELGVFQVALGNATQWEFHMHLWSDPKAVPLNSKFWLVLGIQGKGSARFSSWAHIGYVLEKLGGVHKAILPGDAGNVADFINSQLLHYQLTEHYKGMPLRQGQYEQDLCVGTRMPGEPIPGGICPRCKSPCPPGEICQDCEELQEQIKNEEYGPTKEEVVGESAEPSSEGES